MWDQLLEVRKPADLLGFWDCQVNWPNSSLDSSSYSPNLRFFICFPKYLAEPLAASRRYRQRKGHCWGLSIAKPSKKNTWSPLSGDSLTSFTFKTAHALQYVFLHSSRILDSQDVGLVTRVDIRGQGSSGETCLISKVAAPSHGKVVKSLSFTF